MRYFIATVSSGVALKKFELVLPAVNEDMAEEVIDQLIAHGHTIGGMVGGDIDSEQCEDIEGYGARGVAADSTEIYQFVRTDDAPVLDEGEDDLNLVSIEETDEATYLRAKSEHPETSERVLMTA